jgi:hypothetical protein
MQVTDWNEDRTENVQQTHEMELVETFQPYIIANLEYRDLMVKRVDNYALKS